MSSARTAPASASHRSVTRTTPTSACRPPVTACQFCATTWVIASTAKVAIEATIPRKRISGTPISSATSPASATPSPADAQTGSALEASGSGRLSSAAFFATGRDSTAEP